MDVEEGELFHIYKPELSDLGQKRALTKESGYDESIYSFLNCCSKGMSLIEISIENNFTMQEVSKAFTFCKNLNSFPAMCQILFQQLRVLLPVTIVQVSTLSVPVK